MTDKQVSTKQPNKGGRPSYAPAEKDRAMVKILAGFAVPTERIAQAIGISQPTLFKYFADELQVGAAEVEAKLVGNLLRLAGGTDGTALKAVMFALTCRFGWSQYVPRPDAEKPPGKKEQATIEALTAHEDSDWADLVH